MSLIQGLSTSTVQCNRNSFGKSDIIGRVHHKAMHKSNVIAGITSSLLNRIAVISNGSLNLEIFQFASVYAGVYFDFFGEATLSFIKISNYVP